MALKFSSNMIGDYKDETNFSHQLLLTDRQVSKSCKAFWNSLSAKITLSKNQLSKIIQSREFLGRIIGPLLKTGLLLKVFWCC